jgi:hypothetical protein
VPGDFVVASLYILDSSLPVPYTACIFGVINLDDREPGNTRETLVLTLAATGIRRQSRPSVGRWGSDCQTG